VRILIDGNKVTALCDLSNKPGELAKLCDSLKEANINILAMSIQNAKDAIKEPIRLETKRGGGSHWTPVIRAF